MFYNIEITSDNEVMGHLGIWNGNLMTHAPNRNCVIWMKSEKVAQRMVKRILKKWNNIEVKIKEYSRILR